MLHCSMRCKATCVDMQERCTQAKNLVLLGTLPEIDSQTLASAPEMVPEGGFEPPTRGFSIRCSTPELLGLHGKNRVGAQPIERRGRSWQAQNQSQKSGLVVKVDTVLIIGCGAGNAVAIA